MASVRLPNLEKKLELLYAYSGLTRVDVRCRMKRAESTFTGYLKGTDASDAEMVPEHARKCLAEMLVDAVGGRIAVEDARKLWLGPLDAFAALFHAPRVGVFLEMLGRAQRAEMLTYRQGGGGAGMRLVQFYDAAEDDPGVIRASVGDTFMFDIVGPPHAQIVLMTQSAMGTHLGVPGPGAPQRFDAQGCARLPDTPKHYRFREPRGLHCFLAFAVDVERPLAIAARAGTITPLTESDLEAFGAELLSASHAGRWRLDTLRVNVD